MKDGWVITGPVLTVLSTPLEILMDYVECQVILLGLDGFAPHCHLSSPSVKVRGVRGSSCPEMWKGATDVT